MNWAQSRDFLNANASSQSAPGVTNISTLTGHIQVKNGIAQTNDVKAVLDIGNVGVTGTANLADETLEPASHGRAFSTGDSESRRQQCRWVHADRPGQQSG